MGARAARLALALALAGVARAAAAGSCAQTVTRLAWPRQMKTAGTTVKWFLTRSGSMTGFTAHAFHGTDDVYSRYFPNGTLLRDESRGAPARSHTMPVWRRAEFLAETRAWREPWWWDAHWRYFDMAAGGARPFTIGILREPVSWCVSSSAFNKAFVDVRRRRLGAKGSTPRQPVPKPRRPQNVTFDAFVRKQATTRPTGGCVDPIVRWYCGMDEACDDADDAWVAARARATVEAAFDFIGITERLPASLSLLADLAPDLVPRAVIDAELAKPVVVRPNGRTYVLTDDTVALLHESLARDFLFYAWNERRFDAKVAECGSKRTKQAAKLPPVPTYLEKRAAAASGA